MPLDRKPIKEAKPWIPELLFEPAARPQPQAAPAPASAPAPEPEPAREEVPAALATAAAVQVAAPAPQPVEPPPSPAFLDSDDPAELHRILLDQEKALNKTRIRRRDLQEDISKARRAFMFAERTRLYSAKSALDALLAQDQQGEAEERRLSSEILTVRTKLSRLQR